MSTATTSGSSFFFLLPLLFLLLRQFPTAKSNSNFYSCSERYLYPEIGSYSTNLTMLLSSLVRAAPLTGFANLTAGTSLPDIVYGLALCRGDLNSSVCSSCLAPAALEIFNKCPGSLSGAIFYDGCRLRFSNLPFFSSLTQNPVNPYLYDRRTFRDFQLFRERFATLARGLQVRAANETGRYATGSIEHGGEGRLYGMVQCTRDLSGELCSRCLEDPIRLISCCESNVEVTYQGGSCYLRYAPYLFYNESVLVLPGIGGPFAGGPVAGGPVAGPSWPQNATADGNTPFSLNMGEKKHNYGVIVAIAVGAGILAFLLFIAIKSRRKSKPKHILLGKPKNIDLKEGPGLTFNRLQSRKLSFMRSPRGADVGAIQKLDYQTLKIATENFSENKRVGRGEFGAVYKGDIPGQEFVVKRFTAKSRVELAQLQREFRTFSKLQHTNVVKLLSFHIENEGGEKLVVYEYLPNTSLDRILFDAAAGKPPAQSTLSKSQSSLFKFANRSRPPRYPEADNRRRVLLDWGRRFKIIQGVAQGLLHLHGEGGVNIIHENLKASNVLLDKHMEPKISDCCLPRLFFANQSQEQNKKASTVGSYMAPECASGEKPSAKSDIFSYGVLVLEIVTGQRNRDLLGSESSTNLLSYVWQYWKEEKALQVLDWSLGELYKGHEVLRCIHVGLLCVQEDPDKRPNAASIVQMLNSYSFTLPSPSAPPARGKNGSGAQNGSSGAPANWDWKMYNQNAGQTSPGSPKGWSDVKLESR